MESPRFPNRFLKREVKVRFKFLHVIEECEGGKRSEGKQNLPLALSQVLLGATKVNRCVLKESWK